MDKFEDVQEFISKKIAEQFHVNFPSTEHKKALFESVKLEYHYNGYSDAQKNFERNLTRIRFASLLRILYLLLENKVSTNYKGILHIDEEFRSEIKPYVEKAYNIQKSHIMMKFRSWSNLLSRGENEYVYADAQEEKDLLSLILYILNGLSPKKAVEKVIKITEEVVESSKRSEDYSEQEIQEARKIVEDAKNETLSDNNEPTPKGFFQKLKEKLPETALTASITVIIEEIIKKLISAS